MELLIAVFGETTFVPDPSAANVSDMFRNRKARNPVVKIFLFIFHVFFIAALKSSINLRGLEVYLTEFL